MSKDHNSPWKKAFDFFSKVQNDNYQRIRNISMVDRGFTGVDYLLFTLSSWSVCIFLRIFLLALINSLKLRSQSHQQSSPPTPIICWLPCKKKKALNLSNLLIGSVAFQQLKEAPVSGPSTIRLFFHGFSVEVN